MRVFIVLFVLYLTLFSETEYVQNRWIVNNQITPELYELVQTIENDTTILCKDKIDLTILKNLIEGYSYVQDEALQELLIEEANKVAYRYKLIKATGCYDPATFLEDNFLRISSDNEVANSSNNPILQRLYRVLQKYKKIQQKGGWQKIYIKDVLYLKKGQKYDVIPKIRKRLAIEGFEVEESNETLYDEKLYEVVKEFQKAHSLKADGIIGPMTIDAMNRSVEDKIEQILLNIERARWFLHDDNFFIFVDIPGFFMQVYKNGKPIFYSKVIVGRKSRPTPQMRNVVSYAVLNPYWRAPKTIIQEDILPYLRRGDFEHIEAEHIVASLDPYGKKIIPFDEVDWNDPDSIAKIIFLQLPGPHNFLGFVKFMFPNRFDVYLHDTNARRLFRYEYRALSSGCVRVHKPIELLHLLWTHTKKEICYRDILDLLWQEKTKKVRIAPNVPIYLLYLTVFVDEANKIHFFSDIYGIDKKMLSYKRARMYEKIASKRSQNE